MTFCAFFLGAIMPHGLFSDVIPLRLKMRVRCLMPTREPTCLDRIRV